MLGGGRLHPTELIEIISIVVVISIIIIATLFLKGKMKKFGWLLAVIVLVAYVVFYFARPIWIDTQIDKKVDLLIQYLEERYPGESWAILTVPHREDGYKHLNPYYISVVFESEPDVIYSYWVEKDKIYQISFASDKHFDEFEHLEINLNE